MKKIVQLIMLLLIAYQSRCQIYNQIDSELPHRTISSLLFKSPDLINYYILHNDILFNQEKEVNKNNFEKNAVNKSYTSVEFKDKISSQINDQDLKINDFYPGKFRALKSSSKSKNQVGKPITIS